jgi:hypothetical protein
LKELEDRETVPRAVLDARIAAADGGFAEERTRDDKQEEMRPMQNGLKKAALSGRADLNRRPLEPHSSALAWLRYAPKRQSDTFFTPFAETVK